MPLRLFLLGCRGGLLQCFGIRYIQGWLTVHEPFENILEPTYKMALALLVNMNAFFKQIDI